MLEIAALVVVVAVVGLAVAAFALVAALVKLAFKLALLPLWLGWKLVKVLAAVVLGVALVAVAGPVLLVVLLAVGLPLLILAGLAFGAFKLVALAF